ncbi:MAG: hypothetical protein K5881_09845 [Saccharofermentans sp.]|nr:hypothetical protein [Saccharofermentans sp.]
MKKLEGNKLVALIISAGMTTTFLAACSINTDKLGQGISDLGNAFYTETETEQTTVEPTAEATTATTVTEETEATEATTPVPTATPSPTPLPQRVDYSGYTDINLNDTFTVSSEAFAESSYVDGSDILLAKFEGNRFVVTKAANETVMNSINLIVDGFYKEAAGAYSRAYAKAKAEYDLKGAIENPYNVICDFQYTVNGRALSVLMVYEVTGAEKNTVIDFASFDMISGQYITFNSLCKDPAGLENALRAGLANSLKIQPKPSVEATAPAEGQTSETTIAPAETTAAANTVEAKDFEAVYLAPGPATAEPANNNFATLYGVVDGKVYSAVIDMNAYKDFLNRYGQSIFFT